jgi:hypothetical protein
MSADDQHPVQRRLLQEYSELTKRQVHYGAKGATVGHSDGLQR